MSAFLEWVIAVELAVIAVGVWCYPVPAPQAVVPPLKLNPPGSSPMMPPDVRARLVGKPHEPTKEELDRFLEDMRTTYPPMG